MSDKSKTVADSMEETKERHVRYLRAVNNPIRRGILRVIVEGNDTITSISEATKMDVKTLDWHLKILEDGFCIERAQEKYVLTKEALVVDYLDK
jgi:DNA-binding transcriptional ArsR family regulator